MSTVYCRILENLIMKTSLTRGAMSALFSGEEVSYKNKVIHDLETSKHVKAMGVVRESKGKKKTTKHYFITPEGVRYLIEMSKNDESVGFESKKYTTQPWLRYIEPADTKRMSILGELREERDRVFIVGEAAMIGEVAGATIPFNAHDPETPITEISTQILRPEEIYALKSEMYNLEYTENQRKFQELNKKAEKKKREELIAQGKEPGKNIRAIMAEAVEEWKKETEGKEYKQPLWSFQQNFNITGGKMLERYPSEAEDYIRFVHPTTVKYVALLNSEARDLYDRHDTDRGRYSGLLQSRVRTMLLYPTHKPNFSWSDKMGKVDAAAHMKWQRKLNDEFEASKNEGVCGTLLMQSAPRFKKLWKNPKTAYRSKADLGRNFAHLFVVELNNGGAKNLRSIMLTKTEDHFGAEKERILTADFANSIGGHFEDNRTYYSDMFPVKLNINGEYYYFAIGTWIDIRQSLQIRRLIDKEEDLNFGVICEPWQHEYYKIMIPEAVTYWPGKTTDEIANDYYGYTPEEDEDEFVNEIDQDGEKIIGGIEEK